MRNNGTASRSMFTTIILLAAVILAATGVAATACSRVLSSSNGQAVLVGRNMDWPEKTAISLWALPRGLRRDGLPGENSLVWKSKYGSVVAASVVGNNAFVADGMNERGLVANLLWLDESDYGKRRKDVPGLSVALWAQYVLDTCETVSEAVKAMRSAQYQIVGMKVPMDIPKVGVTMSEATLHLSLADSSGDSAIVEYVGGKPLIHHDRNYTIMTNRPTFEKQQENLGKYRGFGGTRPLPGTADSLDRFVRAAYYMKYLPKPNTLRKAVAGVLSVTRNASQPFSVSVDPKNPYIAATIWRVVADSTNGVYYYESTTSPFLIWADFSSFDLSEGATAMKLDLGKNDPDYCGDVSKKFVRADPSELKVPVF